VQGFLFFIMEGLMISARIAVILIGLFSVSSAFAHFKIGKYEGAYADGESCFFTIISKEFPAGLKHPLNEKVTIKVLEENLAFTHLAIVDGDKTSVRPKKEILSSVKATNYGATAYELFMNENGPYKMVFTNDNYQNTDENFSLTCTSLTYLGE
jgi:hypothetical protein